MRRFATELQRSASWLYAARNVAESSNAAAICSSVNSPAFYSCGSDSSKLVRSQNIRSYCSSSSSEQKKSSNNEEGSSGGENPGGGIDRSRKSLLTRIADSLKEDLKKNSKLQEELQKLRQEQEKLEDTDAMKQAREKYKLVEMETVQKSELIKKKFDDMVKELNKQIQEAAKSEIGKKTLDASKEIVDSVGNAAKKAGDTQVAQTVAAGMKTVADEIDTVTKAKMYKKPEILQTREAYMGTQKKFEADTETTTIDLHKEAKWYRGFKTWYDSSSTVSKMMDLKIKYDESDSRLVRIARFFTDGVQNAIQSTTNTGVSEVLTQITKVDPKFTSEDFIEFVETTIIPNVVEGWLQGDLKVLKDWCHEVPYRILSQKIEQDLQIGFVYDNKILDISRVELITGKMEDQGPIMVISFSVHMINVTRNREGKVVEGNPEKPIKMNHVWALCRDMLELNPKIAWKVLEIHASPADLAI